MKMRTNVIATPIKVIQNTTVKSPDYIKIVHATTGRVLHTGRPAYIKRVAKDRYNRVIK